LSYCCSYHNNRYFSRIDKALLLYSQISALPAPSSDNMKQLKLWLTDPECGNFCIGGAGSEAWGDLYRESELPSLRRLLLKLLKSLNLFGKLKHPQNRADLVAPSPH